MRASFHIRSGERGFTLIEVLASLLIFSVGILALTRSVTNGVRVASEVETRTLAGIVAENQIARARADADFLVDGPARREGSAEQMDTDFDWRIERRDTDAPDFLEIVVEVSADDRLLIERRTYISTADPVAVETTDQPDEPTDPDAPPLDPRDPPQDEF